MEYKEVYSKDPQTYEKRLEALTEIFDELQVKYKLENFKFTVNPRLRKSLGQCTFNGIIGEVQVAKGFIALGEWIGVIDTLLHESAHAMDFNYRGDSRHDRIWKMFCLRIGANPERTSPTKKVGSVYLGSLKESAKYTLKCPVCGFETYQHRKTKRVYGHAPCNTTEKQAARGFKPYEITQNY